MEKAGKMVKSFLASVEKKAGKKISYKNTKTFRKMFSKNERAEADTEFMMNYGWAAIGIMVVIIALVISGVFNNIYFMPEGCILPEGISCIDSKVESDNIKLVFTNNLGGPLTILNVTATEIRGSICYATYVPYYIKDKASGSIDITGCDNGLPGEKFKSIITLNYKVENLIEKHEQGTVFQRID